MSCVAAQSTAGQGQRMFPTCPCGLEDTRGVCVAVLHVSAVHSCVCACCVGSAGLHLAVPPCLFSWEEGHFLAQAGLVEALFSVPVCFQVIPADLRCL